MRRHSHPNVTFHPWGLAGECRRQNHSDAAFVSQASHGALTSDLFSVQHIRGKLRHARRRISIMKLDCEGCEWDALYDMAVVSPSPLADVDGLIVELHPVSTNAWLERVLNCLCV